MAETQCPTGSGASGSTLPVDLVVFDMTGTTVSDADAVVEAYRSALEEFAIAYTEAGLVAARGAAKHEVFFQFARRARPDADPGEVAELARAAHGAFQRKLDDAYATGPLAPIPGAAATFDWLRTRGVRVALTTGFDRALQRRILTRLGWEPGVVIDIAVAADEVARGRPAPDMIQLAMARAGVGNAGRVAVVGDTVVDLEAGTNARARLVIGVLTGAHDRARLATAPHTHLLASVADVPALLEALS